MDDLLIDRASLVEVWGLPNAEPHLRTLEAEFRSGRLSVYGFRSGGMAPDSVPPGYYIDWIGPKRGENRGPCASETKRLFCPLFVPRATFPNLCWAPPLSRRPPPNSGIRTI